MQHRIRVLAASQDSNIKKLLFRMAAEYSYDIQICNDFQELFAQALRTEMPGVCVYDAQAQVGTEWQLADVLDLQAEHTTMSHYPRFVIANPSEASTLLSGRAPVSGVLPRSFTASQLHYRIENAISPGKFGCLLARKRSLGHFDFLISYNRADSDRVGTIIHEFEMRGLRPWSDRHGRPGDWQADIERRLEQLPIVIVVGPNGIGRWQLPESRAAFSLSVEDGATVIPLLLEGAEKEAVPRFLRTLQCIDLNVQDPDGYSYVELAVREDSQRRGTALSPKYDQSGKGSANEGETSICLDERARDS